MPVHLSRSNQRAVVLTSGGVPDVGEIRTIDPEICPDCFKRVKITTRGVRRRHNNRRGIECSASGLRVRLCDVTIDPSNPPPVNVKPRPVSQPTETFVVSDPGEPDPRACPECGAIPPGFRRNDGRIRRHRIDPQDPFSPWCKASPKDRTD